MSENPKRRKNGNDDEKERRGRKPVENTSQVEDEKSSQNLSVEPHLHDGNSSLLHDDNRSTPTSIAFR